MFEQLIKYTYELMPTKNGFIDENFIMNLLCIDRGVNWIVGHGRINGMT